MHLFLRRSDSLLTASKGERSEAIEKLIAATSISGSYYLLLTLSVLIVTPGLLLNNTAVIIGGMILAPLLAPILLLSLSLVTRSTKGILHSTMVLLFSIMEILAFSAALTWVISHSETEVRWIPDQPDTELYVLIACCSGIAAAFAWVKKDMAANIAGVAIAVSLLPPLCAAGIGLALLQMEMASDSAILFLANVAGIIAGAMIVFMMMGFLPARKIEEKVMEAR